MIEAYKSYFENYFNFKGKSTRAEYWWVVLMNFIITFALNFMYSICGGAENPIGMMFYGLSSLYALVTFIPSLSILVRRFHDINKSVIWIIIYYIINIISAIILFIVFILLICIVFATGNEWFIIPGIILLLIFGTIPFVSSIIILIFTCLDSATPKESNSINTNNNVNYMDNINNPYERTYKNTYTSDYVNNPYEDDCK